MHKLRDLSHPFEMTGKTKNLLNFHPYLFPITYVS